MNTFTFTDNEVNQVKLALIQARQGEMSISDCNQAPSTKYKIIDDVLKKMMREKLNKTNRPKEK